MNRIRMLAFALMAAIGALKVELLLRCIVSTEHCEVYIKPFFPQKNFENPSQITRIRQAGYQALFGITSEGNIVRCHVVLQQLPIYLFAKGIRGMMKYFVSENGINNLTKLLLTPPYAQYYLNLNKL